MGNWYVDIGDHVQGPGAGLIDTPELDAQLAAARAQFKGAQAGRQVMRKAEARFAKSTYERWRDSPKGVVSEQEREEKHGRHDSAAASNAARAQVALDKANVDQYTPSRSSSRSRRPSTA